MNNSATTRRISKIAIEYNGNDKGTAQRVYQNNLLSQDPELQFKEMKTIAERNKNVKNWALTGYISPEKSIGDKLSNEELTGLALKALKKIGVSDNNQMVLDIHCSTKQKHIHFIVNRVNTLGVNTIQAHRIGENFGKAVREVCQEMNLKTDIEIGKEKKKLMLEALMASLKISRNFEELIGSMKKLGYRITLSQNEKVGISGMRIVRFEDINHRNEREYKPGYKLSEITNILKIKDIKQKLQENRERMIVFNPIEAVQGNKDEQKNLPSVSKQLEDMAKELLKPTFISSPEDELLKKKKRKFR
ncbi:relaxase/mobilization nuclease domain-containing protein [Elizabethkingia ursingii]|uniref:relaxase/mobilization nuclease domain-containing protein n=1 Tax=Elizabethkingia TaxID=308865 RepID=UPI0020124418|nr:MULTISPECIES: relaxase/mobilization nuclease domain-containing protein [Elizabethkingia]MCL1667518.1 relaxase/mobilization nuclease domain-containing protein [Elizabethkingia ursingii]WQM40485.1 relaxase/mobilization nuclease domain-containing protein [Elizabethkingia miricola]